ncbi:MAG: helix-turn-helix domain-containing protein [Actinomycetota bacterium]|nr:helix-turn-helix domain-containing protein [Actinomycetota bacterium]
MTDSQVSLDSTNLVPVAAEAMTAASVLPPSFWEDEALQDAFKSRHFGQLLKAYRCAHVPTLKQETVAHWLGLTQGQISRIERSSTPIRDLTKLSTWVMLLHVPPSHLWFTFESDECSSPAKSPIMDADQMEDENVQRRTLLKSVGLGATFLTDPVDKDSRVTGTLLSRYPLDKQDIAVMREMTTNFRRLDNRFGGGHAYSVVENYIATHVEPTIKFRRYSEALRSELLSAAVELYQLAGWMAYDTGDHSNGGRHLNTALNLCKEVRNDALAAEMLAGMSHQASFNRQADSAVQLASAAGYAARRAGVPRLQAEASVMEAHGLALRGDHRSCIQALQQAERYFSGDTGSSPEWLRYFDEAYLSAKFGHALRDLRRPSEAERFARASLQMTEGYERGRLFNTALLAGVLADQGKVEESVQHATLAVQMSGTMRSGRTTMYLTDVYNRLLPYKDKESVQSLYRSMRGAGVRTRTI